MSQVQPPISELTLAATPNAVSWARRHTVDVLQRWRFPVESIEVARLLVSELTTNAIQHACSDAPFVSASTEPAELGTVVLRLWPTGSGVVVSVSDSDPRPPRPRASDGSATGGRGLLLTEVMSSRWGYFHPKEHRGKIVWVEVPTQPRAGISEPGAGGPETTPLMMGRVLTALRDL
ncbi:ATP-binding protein [Streptomyces sp. ISL-112]|uniref:ATP-binding protein n=1 Tax=unclassified Streptomyces TaxID=2593676 RepID=UPI001BEB993D|nr:MULTISPECIES: ATP-binding protein [unclassified Streptomyces]MBT2425143.1 ATP-binding protein [Streptomyces sp. ISL-112]MBT2461935.1 ATP-binding protein [Streptomyces sp. ISL-63]